MSVAAVDIGKTRTRAVLFTADARTVSRLKSEQLRKQSPTAAVETLRHRIQSMLRDVSQSPTELSATAIACPVPVDQGTTTVAPFREAEFDFDALADLAPVAVHNDATAGAIGAYVTSPDSVTSLLYVAIGTGIGGGAVIEGQLLSGADGQAGEIGHISVRDCELPCPGCDGSGHWEAACSGSQLPALADESGLDVSSAAELFNRAEDDAAAQAVLDRMHDINAEALTQLCNVLNPDRIVFAGGVVLNNPEIVDEAQSRMGPGCLVPIPELAVAEHGDLTNVYGLRALATGTWQKDLSTDEQG